MSVSFSHFEFRARDIPLMEAFYTQTLGFYVTDRSPPKGDRRGDQMVFLSLHPGEHHQIVLGQAEKGHFSAGSFDHLAFR